MVVNEHISIAPAGKLSVELMKGTLEDSMDPINEAGADDD